MKNIRTYLELIIFLAIVSVAAGCSTIRVQYDYDTQANFTAFRTYNWLPAPRKGYKQPLVVGRVKRAVNNSLENQGFNISDDHPDFLIAVRVGERERIEVVSWGYAYYPNDRYWGGYWGPYGITTYRYREGSIVLDFIDGRTRELFWRGTATSILDSDLKPEEMDKLVTRAVKKILGNFPPP